VVALLYLMLLVGMVVSALVVGAILHDFTYYRLIALIQGAAVVTAVFNIIAIWRQEPRDLSTRRQCPTRGCALPRSLG
jgi:MFS transporter, BCD family, chlorophyll transporter